MMASVALPQPQAGMKRARDDDEETRAHDDDEETQSGNDEEAAKPAEA